MYLAKQQLKEESLRYLHTALSNILHEGQNGSLSLSRSEILEIKSKLAQFLTKYLLSDKEHKLQEALNTYCELQQKRDSILKEVCRVQKNGEYEIQNAHMDNVRIKQNLETLKKKLVSLEEAKKKNDQKVIDTVKKQNITIRNSDAFASHATFIKVDISENLRDARNQIIYLTQVQHKEIRNVKESLKKYVENIITTQLKKNSPQITAENEEIRNKIVEEKKRLASNVQICKDILVTFQKKFSAAPENITLTNLPDSYDQIKTYYKKSLDEKFNKEMENIQHRVVLAIPELEDTTQDNMYEELKRIIKKKTSDMEKACQMTLEKSAKREEKLKSKLSYLISHLETLKNEDDDTEVLISEINELRNQWISQKSVLDEKMAISKSMLSSLQSGTP